MKKLSIFNRQGFPAFLFYLLYILILLIFIISGCGSGGGGDANSSSELSETASASFTLEWHDPTDINVSINSPTTTQKKAEAGRDAVVNQVSETGLMTAQADTVDCGIIENIICEVYDGSNESNTFLTSEVFECSAHQGRIDNIPAGENRIFVILATDKDGNILYHGKVSGITITPGETNDLGVIDCYYFVPTLLSPGNNSEVIFEEFSLRWTPVETAYEYCVQVSVNPDFGDPLVIDETISDPEYTPSGLSEFTTYYWRVFVQDIHGNQGMVPQELWRSFTVISQVQCTFTILPEIRLFASGGGAGSISVTSSASGCNWTASEGVDWINITSGSTGTGTGTVTYTVSENTTGSLRTAIITVAGQSHTVTQEVPVGACTYSISPVSQSFTSSGGTGTIRVTSSETTCSWTASESASWINITSANSGTGNGTVTYTVSENTTGSMRTAIITVAGEIHTVTQEPLIMQTGSLQVTITPAEAVSAGAQWQVDGGSWHTSGDIQSGLSVGTHMVSFSDVSGWITPGNQNVTIFYNQTTNASGNYTTPTGSLQVTITPAEAVSAGAQWQVDGGNWHISGDIQSGLSVGSHTLSFSDVSGWITPGDQNVDIVYNQTINASGNYARPSPIISGYVGTSSETDLSGVTLTFSNNGGTATTNSSGVFSHAVSYGWSGTVTPSDICYDFSPADRSFSNVTTDQTGVDFSGEVKIVQIYGYVLDDQNGSPVPEVELRFPVGGGQWASEYTDSDGYYSINVWCGYSGDVEPRHQFYEFDPLSRSYQNLTEDSGPDNYVATEPQ